MPLMWNIFYFLRIIPKPGTKYINKIALMMWLIIIIACAVFLFLNDFYCSGQLCSFPSYSYVVSGFLYDTLHPLQSVLVLCVVAALANKIRDLRTDLVYPKYPVFFLLTTLLNFTSAGLEQLYSYTGSPLCIWCAVAYSILSTLHLVIISAARAIIGVTVNRFCNDVEECFAVIAPENIQVIMAPIITEYKILKEQLSFLLLTLYTADVILLTAHVYLVAHDLKYWFFLVSALYLILQLSYIAFVVDNCYSALKSTLPILRFLLLFIFWIRGV